MNETILKIDPIVDGERWSMMEGYAITTDKQVIKLLIDSGQSCCEHWGYFLSEDNLNDFIGATLTDIAITDTVLKSHLLEANGVDDPSGEWFHGGIMFVNLSTSKGLLQFVAYNEHNGYYGHEAKVVSEQLNHSENL